MQCSLLHGIMEKQIKLKANYASLCKTCSVVLVSKRGDLFQVSDNFNIGKAEALIKVTKNYLGPKIQYIRYSKFHT